MNCLTGCVQPAWPRTANMKGVLYMCSWILGPDLSLDTCQMSDPIINECFCMKVKKMLRFLMKSVLLSYFCILTMRLWDYVPKEIRHLYISSQKRDILLAGGRCITSQTDVSAWRIKKHWGVGGGGGLESRHWRLL